MNEERAAHPDPSEIAAWIAGTLEVAPAASIGRHVDECGACQAEADLARAFFADVDISPAAGMNEQFRGRLAAAGHGVPTRRALRVRPRHVGGLLAVAAAVTFAVIGLRTSAPETGVPEPSGTVRSSDADIDWDLTARTTADGWAVSWTPPPAVSDITLLVRSASGEDLLRRVVEGSEFTLLRADLGQLPESLLFVQLRARGRSGQTIESTTKPLP